MSTQKSDWEVRQLFERLRSEELSRVPSLNQVLAKQERSGGTSAAWAWVRLGTALALPLLLAMVLLFLPRVYSPDPTDEELELVAAVFEWEAPTDFLLDSDGEDLLTALPELEMEAWTEDEATEQ